MSTARRFISDLTNDAIMRALSIDDDALAERLLQEYFGQDLAKVKELYRERGPFISGAVVHKIKP